MQVCFQGSALSLQNDGQFGISCIGMGQEEKGGRSPENKFYLLHNSMEGLGHGLPNSTPSSWTIWGDEGHSEIRRRGPQGSEASPATLLLGGCLLFTNTLQRE